MLSFRAVVQRVRDAEVVIEGQSQGKIPQGLMVFFGVGTAVSLVKPADGLEEQDTEGEKCLAKYRPVLEKLSLKIMNLRIFEEGKSVLDIDQGVYIVSQFTLFADVSKGSRPSYTKALPGSLAEPLYSEFVKIFREKSHNVKEGKFGASMRVSMVNDGPVTCLLEADLKGIRSL